MARLSSTSGQRQRLDRGCGQRERGCKCSEGRAPMSPSGIGASYSSSVSGSGKPSTKGAVQEAGDRRKLRHQATNLNRAQGIKHLPRQHPIVILIKIKGYLKLNQS